MIDPSAFYAGGIAVRTYDLFATSPANAGDIDFYVGCAKRFGTDVLELGTGTGRVAIPLVSAGCTVSGLDLSDAMLDVARQKATGLSPDVAARLTLVRGDMSDFDLGRRFRAGDDSVSRLPASDRPGRAAARVGVRASAPAAGLTSGRRPVRSATGVLSGWRAPA